MKKSLGILAVVVALLVTVKIVVGNKQLAVDPPQRSLELAVDPPQ